MKDKFSRRVFLKFRSCGQWLRAMAKVAPGYACGVVLLICVVLLTNQFKIDSADAYSISIGVEATGCRGILGNFEGFAESDGAVSKQVQVSSSGQGCGGAASAFAKADLGARTLQVFNTSTKEGFSDAYAEFTDRYFITGVSDEIQSVDVGASVSFDGTVEGLTTDGYQPGNLRGYATSFATIADVRVDILETGGTFADSGILTFNRLAGGGFNHIDIVMRINSIALFGVGTVDFSNTGFLDFDLSFLPDSADLVSESGFSVRASQPKGVPEPASLLLLGSGLVGMALLRRKLRGH